MRKKTTLIVLVCALMVTSLYFSLIYAQQPQAPTPLPTSAPGPGIRAIFLTPQVTRDLKNWTEDDLKNLAKGGSNIQVLKFFEESTKDLDWKSTADIDLLNVYGQKPEELVRLPRFMIVREWVRLVFYRKSGRLSLEVAGKAALSVPKQVFEIHSISKIEFTQHATMYPNIQLKTRTNPAASRGEKFFERNCLSCHSIPGKKSIDPSLLTAPFFDQFFQTHKSYKEMILTPKDIRGLAAYRDALASERNDVKSSK